MVMLDSNDCLGLSTNERVLAATRDALAVSGTGTGVYLEADGLGCAWYDQSHIVAVSTRYVRGT